MFSTKKEQKRKIQDEIDHNVAALEKLDPVTDVEKYKEVAANLETLYRAASYKTKDTVSWDVIVTAVVNIAGILLVLKYEELHVVSSKAFGMIIRPK